MSRIELSRTERGVLRKLARGTPFYAATNGLRGTSKRRLIDAGYIVYKSETLQCTNCKGAGFKTREFEEISDEGRAAIVEDLYDSPKKHRHDYCLTALASTAQPVCYRCNAEDARHAKWHAFDRTRGNVVVLCDRCLDEEPHTVNKAWEMANDHNAAKGGE